MRAPILLIAGALISACVSAPPPPETYLVRAGDTLYSIAWRHDLDYRALARWNGLGPDFHITIGEVLRLHAPGGMQPNSPASTGAPESAAPAASFPWGWPTEATAAPSAAAGGILVPGHAGQDVRAAAAGRVVYTGNGIRGYGNLIIIKHPAGMLSAYAHNRETLVREGEAVALGTPIARMGEASAGSPGLYFEIRHDGRPVDPLSYLPRTSILSR